MRKVWNEQDCLSKDLSFNYALLLHQWETHNGGTNKLQEKEKAQNISKLICDS